MNELVLIPYIEINGEWTLPDLYIVDLFRLAEKEGTAETVFYSGGINDGYDFIELLQQKDAYPVIIVDKSGPPVGVIWLRDFAKNYAYGHFLFFSNSWGNGKAIEGAKMAIDHFFNFKKPDGVFLFDVLIGVFAEENKKAFDFVLKVGFTIVGTIPKMLYNRYENRQTSAVYSYIERKG